MGRVANRIADATFTLNGQDFKLAANNGPNHLHGGVFGFDKKVWDFVEYDSESTSLTLQLISPDGDEGYPGCLTVILAISLSQKNVVSLNYSATTDTSTIVNMTNHSYFNFGGKSNIYDHNLQILANSYLDVDCNGLSVGRPLSVKGTVFDYTEPTMLGYRLDHMVTAENPNGGIDNCFCDFTTEVKSCEEQPSMHRVAVLDSESEKLRLIVSTSNPALHVYTGNYLRHLDEEIKGSNSGTTHGRHSGICFETQIHPDAINRQEFPSPILQPGELYHHLTTFAVETLPDMVI